MNIIIPIDLRRFRSKWIWLEKRIKRLSHIPPFFFFIYHLLYFILLYYFFFYYIPLLFIICYILYCYIIFFFFLLYSFFIYYLRSTVLHRVVSIVPLHLENVLNVKSSHDKARGGRNKFRSEWIQWYYYDSMISIVD